MLGAALRQVAARARGRSTGRAPKPGRECGANQTSDIQIFGAVVADWPPESRTVRAGFADLTRGPDGPKLSAKSPDRAPPSRKPPVDSARGAPQDTKMPPQSMRGACAGSASLPAASGGSTSHAPLFAAAIPQRVARPAANAPGIRAATCRLHADVGSQDRCERHPLAAG